MSIFTLHSNVLADYRDFVRSFFSVADDRTREFIERELVQEARLWPEALLQVSPSYARVASVDELAARGVLLTALALPLLAIHGILNPQFRPEHLAWGFLPLRPSGAEFAIVIAFRLLLVACAMAIWRYTVGSQVIGFFQRLGLPSSVITVFAIATSSVQVVQQRGRAVYLAQQARGVDVRASFRARVVSLPKLVIPVAVATIVESAERGVVMESRGLGSGSWRLSGWYLPPSRSRVLTESVSALVTLAAFGIS